MASINDNKPVKNAIELSIGGLTSLAISSQNFARTMAALISSDGLSGLILDANIKPKKRFNSPEPSVTNACLMVAISLRRLKIAEFA